MPNYVKLPNGSYYEAAEGQNYTEAVRAAYRDFPEAFGQPGTEPKPQGGFVPAAKAGIASLKSDIAALAGRAGAIDEATAEKYIQEQEAYKKKTFAPTQEGWTEAPWTKFKETLGGSLPYMAAPLAAGTSALLLPEAIAAAPVLGGLATAGELASLGAAGAASATQFTGSNLSRQIEEGKKLSETDLTAAALAALPQAALDSFSFKMIPGIRQIFTQAGKELTPKMAADIAKQGTAQVFKDYTLATGKAMGTEGLTEAGQQFFERLQAGLSLTDEKARNEYFDNFIGGAMLGGALAPAGRYAERGTEKRKQLEQAQKQAQTEALEKARLDEEARSTPEALRALDNQFLDASRQLRAMNAALGKKPGKDASEEEKAAYAKAVEARNAFSRETYAPIKAEHDKRKDAINAVYAAIEASAATQEQATAAAALPSDLPGASEYSQVPLARLMDRHDVLTKQVDAIEEKLAAGPSIEEQDVLHQQRTQLRNTLDVMGKTIEELGGVTGPVEDFQKKLLSAEKERLRLLGLGDFDAAAKQAQKIKGLQAKLPLFEEMQGLRTKLGQTRDLFEESPAPQTTAVDETQKQQVLQSERERAPYGAQDLRTRRQAAMDAFGMADIGPRGQLEAAPTQEDMFAQNVSPLRQKQAQDAATKLDNANADLATAVKTGDQRAVQQALQEINKYEAQTSRLGQPYTKSHIIDLFDPSNILREAVANNDWKTAMDFTKARDESKALTLEEQSKQRAELDRALSDKMGVGGTERTLKSFDEIAAGNKDLADVHELLRSGSYPDSVGAQHTEARQRAENLQEKFDRSPEAFAYDFVMDQIADLKKKVETRQGNAKTSLLQKLIDIAEEHATLTQRLEQDVAAPTMREKAAELQAKLGKGEAPAKRGMDAAEKAQAKRRLARLEKDYQAVLDKITPIKNKIVEMYNSLFNYKKVETVAETEKQKRALSEAPAKAVADRFQAARDKLKTAEAFKDPEAIAQAKKELERLTSMSREAKKQKRIEEGKVKPEAEKSEKMVALAYGLGKETEGFSAELQKAGDRLEKLIAKYGADDPAVSAFRQSMREHLTDVAVAEGRKTPEFRDAMKEHVAEFKRALTESTQVPASKRDKTPVTRRVSQAKKEERTGSPESRAATKEREEGAVKRQTPEQIRAQMKGAVKRANKSDTGTAYRTRDESTETVVDAAEAQKLVDEVKKNLPENVNFVYAATPGEIPLSLLKKMAAEGIEPRDAMVQGAVFRDGTVLVVGDQHANIKDLEETIAHELVGHYGIDTVIGIDRLQAYANNTDILKLAQEVGGDKLAAEVKATMEANAALGRSEEIQKLQGLRELIAHTEEQRVTEGFRQKAGRWLKELVGMVRSGLRRLGLTEMAKMSTSDVFYALKKSRQAFESKKIGAYRTAEGEIAFRSRRHSTSSVIGREAGLVDTLLGNIMGLAGRVQLVDKHAALSEAFKKGMKAGQITSHEAQNAEFLLRFGEQRSQFAGQFLTNGPVVSTTTKTADGITHMYESTKGPTLMGVAEALNKGGFENDTRAEEVLTLYEAGQRAKQLKGGWAKLDFSDPAAAEREYNAMMAELGANPKQKAAVEEASKLYQKYNAGLLDFLVQTGAMSEAKAKELKSISYVPFYRVTKNGEVQLMVDKEHPVRIGNTKDQPELKSLVGGNQSIMPIFSSAVQNTFMLTGMGLRNQSVKETSYMLHKIGIASRVGKGFGPASDAGDVVRFKVKGEDWHAVIDTDQHGIPADLIVKGMEGIKTTIPVAIKLLGMPANLLRKFVTRNPVYALRQVVRDPLNAWLTTGTDAVPVLSSMKELAHMVAGRSETERVLMESGAISSNVFAGTEQDMSKFLRDVTAGKSGWDRTMAKLDAIAMQGDAATRAVVYRDSIAKGMTHQQALLRTLESMNFSRKGLSPSLQMLSTVIPFFNAQIQGLDVLYRAFKGDMPFNEQLRVREKLVQRGLLLAAGTMAYAAAMQDDESYKRAKPSERYGNWFVYIPGVSEPVRVPIPFELGYLFKALPEAVYGLAAGDEKTSKAIAGMGALLGQSNPFSLPQAVKPLTEAYLGKSFFAGDIESQREKQELPTERYRDSTTELSKLLGKVTGKAGVSPITLDYLIRGYTGPLGVALVQLANPVLSTATSAAPKESPSTKPSKLPFIGGLFQPVEGRGTLDEAYDRMEEIKQAKGTFAKMVEEGRLADARAFAQDFSNGMALASTSGAIQKQLGELAKQERIIANHPTMSQEEKDIRLERLDKIKLQIARSFLQVVDKTKSQ